MKPHLKPSKRAKKERKSARPDEFKLFLIRHAQAVAAEERPSRPLSAKGRKQAGRLARFFKGNDRLDIDELWHSPLSRSIETAAILVRELGLSVPCVQVRGIAPSDDPGPTAERVRKFGRDLAIVGHEPHLSALAGLLLGGSKTPIAIEMKKGACLALERTARGWGIRWMVVPGLLGGKRRRG